MDKYIAIIIFSLVRFGAKKSVYRQTSCQRSTRLALLSWLDYYLSQTIEAPQKRISIVTHKKKKLKRTIVSNRE